MNEHARSASLPKVSCVIPTLNAGKILGNCLRSIRAQDYPQAQIEIIVADGGSTDETLDLAKQYDAIVIANPRRIAEAGKQEAMKLITGEYVVFADADNEIASTDFIRLAVLALTANPDALGLESYYLASPRMSSFCVYLTQTMHIGDPVAWMVSVTPRLIGTIGEVECWTFPAGSLAFPLGANGFVYRRKTLMLARPEEDFEDTHVALRIAKTGRTTWLRLRGRGVHHYLVSGLRDFVRKRRRQTYHFLSLRGRPKGESWTDMKPSVPPLVGVLYCATVVGPVCHTVYGIARTRDWHWLWHPVACLASVLGLAWGVATFKLGPRTADAEASLQPKQTIGAGKDS
jgi:glycosyltransferase involved in cell wall biosynthesis